MPIQPQYVATVLKAPKEWFSDIEECQRNLHHKGLQPPVATKKGNHTHGSSHSVPLQLSSGNLPKILREYISAEGVNSKQPFFFLSHVSLSKAIDSTHRDLVPWDMTICICLSLIRIHFHSVAAVACVLDNSGDRNDLVGLQQQGAMEEARIQF